MEASHKLLQNAKTEETRLGENLPLETSKAVCINGNGNSSEIFGHGLDSISIEINIDEAFNRTNPRGRFQIILQVAVIYIFLTISYNFILAYFTGSDPPWTCVSKNSSDFCVANYGKEISSGTDKFTHRCKLNRSEWRYTTARNYSFVTEFELICENTKWAALTSSLYYIGGMVGAILSGLIVDVYGRKLVLHLALVGTVVISIACSYVKTYVQLTALYGVLGAFSVVCYFTAFIYQSEFAIPSYRSTLGTSCILAASLSFLLMDVVAYFIRTWRQLQMYASLPILLVLFVTVFLPESPRWLLAIGKYDKAVDILKSICRVNGLSGSNIRLKRQVADDGKKYTYADLFRSCKVFTLTAAVSSLWFIVALVYYGIALQSSNLGGNIYAAMGITTLADIGGAIICLNVSNRFGRKKSILGGFLISGVLIISMVVVPQSLSYRFIINVVIMMLARMTDNSAFIGMYIWTAELFPTVLRSQGMLVCVVFERAGLLVVPFITRVLSKVNYMLPYIIMSVFAFAAVIIGLILPETNKLRTRESYEDFFTLDEINPSSNAIGRSSRRSQEESEIEKVPLLPK